MKYCECGCAMYMHTGKPTGCVYHGFHEPKESSMPEYLYSPRYGAFHVTGEDSNGYRVEPLDPQGMDSRINYVDKALAGTPTWSLEKPVAQRKQIGGNHYSKHTIQPWDIVDEYELDYYLGNVVKYVLRDKNNKLEDLEKALHFLEKRIELEKSRVSKEG